MTARSLQAPLAPKATCSPGALLQRKHPCSNAPQSPGGCDERTVKARELQDTVTSAPFGHRTKIIVSRPDDKHEQEADRVANEVMSSVGPGAGAGLSPASATHNVQPLATSDRRYDNADVNLHGSSSAIGDVPQSVYEVLKQPGQPLDSESRAFMEPCFRRDFSRVRIHTDRQAAESASAVQAQAYAVGDHIVFGQGDHPSRNYRLLAHELTHVVQQFGNNSSFQKNQNGSLAASCRLQRQVASNDGGPPSRTRSVSNLIDVGWRSRKFLDKALIAKIQNLKDLYEHLDTSVLMGIATPIMLQFMARFVPGLGEALLIKDLAELGQHAIETVEKALYAQTDAEKDALAFALAGVIVTWVISRVIRKLGQAIGPRNKVEVADESEGKVGMAASREDDYQRLVSESPTEKSGRAASQGTSIGGRREFGSYQSDRFRSRQISKVVREVLHADKRLLGVVPHEEMAKMPKGLAAFGTAIQKPIRQILLEQGYPIDKLKASWGPDFPVATGMRGQTRFDFIEVKPHSESGIRKFLEHQFASSAGWSGRAKLVTYGRDTGAVWEIDYLLETK